MAKEIAIGKRAKISEAQQVMLLSVLGASVVLGAAISLISHFVQQISFNADVISKEDASIVAYSNAIKTIGICAAPSGSTYSVDELKKCNPDSIDVSSVPGTLRYNILEEMAKNEALNSVPKESTSDCINPSTGKNYTYEEMENLYDSAGGDSTKLLAATSLIQSCSALRVIPDALPSSKNEEALLSSLNKIFNTSGWEPDALSPSGSTSSAGFGDNLNALSVSLSVEANTAITMRVLNNIERSIRDFEVRTATIEWRNGNLNLQAQASAYYMTPSRLAESTTTLNPEGGKK